MKLLRSDRRGLPRTSLLAFSSAPMSAHVPAHRPAWEPGAPGASCVSNNEDEPDGRRAGDLPPASGRWRSPPGGAFSPLSPLWLVGNERSYESIATDASFTSSVFSIDLRDGLAGPKARKRAGGPPRPGMRLSLQDAALQRDVRELRKQLRALGPAPLAAQDGARARKQRRSLPPLSRQPGGSPHSRSAGALLPGPRDASV